VDCVLWLWSSSSSANLLLPICYISDPITPLVCSHWKFWCHLGFSSAFAVVPNIFLLYKLCCMCSDSYISWLSSYIISGHVFSQLPVFIRHPLKCSLVIPKDLSFGSNYLFISVLCTSIKHSKYFCLPTLKICWFHNLCNWQYTSTIAHWFHLWSVCCWLYGTILTKLKSQVHVDYVLS
jgi:hypothetical protein